MSSAVSNQVIAGFSTTNRWLIYISLLLAPFQFFSGLGTKIPINLGFLGYNIYQQFLWYTAAKNKQLHALSLLPVNLNIVYAVTYLGGATAGNYFGVINGLGTAAMLLMNTATAWISWKTNMPEGYGVYEFFFFSWHTMSPSWHRFFAIWQVVDTVIAIVACVVAIALGCSGVIMDEDELREKVSSYQWQALLVGPVIILVFLGAEMIVWMELIVKRNHIQSETDMIAVYLFIAQVVLMVLGGIIDLCKKLRPARSGTSAA